MTRTTPPFSAYCFRASETAAPSSAVAAGSTTNEYFSIRDWKLQKGRLFNETEEESGVKVVLLGQTVSEKLFGPGVDPLGRFVRIRSVPFEVIGLLEAKGQSGMGQNSDDTVFVPASTFQTVPGASETGTNALTVPPAKALSSDPKAPARR